MDKENIQRRYYPIEELRTDDDETKIMGYAAVFDELSQPLFMGQREKIEQGAFEESIRKDDIRALWNHDPSYVLGRNQAGTLTLEEDEKGLWVEIDPPDAQWANDLIESIERGDVDQMSIGFQVVDYHRERMETDGDDDEIVNVLTEAKLYDVSPVTFPAYTQTSVDVRASFNGAGLNFEGLAESLQRAQRGQLNDSDHALIEASIQTLRSYLGQSEDSEPVEDSGSEVDLEFEVEKRKRLLQLQEEEE